MRTTISACLACLILAATATHIYDNSRMDHWQNIALKGYCMSRDIDRNVYWYVCQSVALAPSEEANIILGDMKKAGKKR
jgi:hypothetical protein